jgi:membrane associated rhomboid family serine protease
MFKILLIVLIINMGILMWGRIKRGFFRDPVYNSILLVGLLLGINGYVGSQSGNSLSSWFAVGIFIGAVLVPMFLNSLVSRAVVKSQLRLAHKLLQVKYLFQPSVDVKEQIDYNLKIINVHRGEVDDIIREIEAELREVDEPDKRRVILETLVEILVFAGKWEEGLATYKSKLEKHGDIIKPTLFVALVRAAAETSQWELMWAFYHMLKSLDYDKDDGLAQKSLFFVEVIILASYGKSDTLKKILAPIHKGDPLFPAAPKRYWLGLSYLTEGKRDKAEKLLVFSMKLQEQAPTFYRAGIQHLKQHSPPGKKSDKTKQLLESITLKFHHIAEEKKNIIKTIWVIKAYIGICVSAFLFQLYLGSTEDFYILYKIGGNFRGLTLEGQWWRSVTAMFYHANFLHLLFNMYGVWIFGPLLESHFGKIKIILILFLSGIAGNYASAYFGSPHGVSIGASTSLFGLIGAMFVMLIAHKDRWNERWRKKQLMLLMFVLAVQVVFGFSVDMVDNAAHMGGLVGGVIIALLLGASYHLSSVRVVFTRIIALVSLLVLVVALYLAVGFSLNEQWKEVIVKKDKITLEYPAFWHHGFYMDESVSVAPGQKKPKRDIISSSFCKGRNAMLIFTDEIALVEEKKCSTHPSLPIPTKHGSWIKYRFKVGEKSKISCFYNTLGKDKTPIVVLFHYDDKCKTHIEKYAPQIINKINILK